MKRVVLLVLLMSGCHVYSEDYACIPVVTNPAGGVTIRNCAWLYEDEDAGIEQ